jgi:hypothetical protein
VRYFLFYSFWSYWLCVSWTCLTFAMNIKPHPLLRDDHEDLDGPPTVCTTLVTIAIVLSCLIEICICCHLNSDADNRNEENLHGLISKKNDPLFFIYGLVSRMQVYLDTLCLIIFYNTSDLLFGISLLAYIVSIGIFTLVHARCVLGLCSDADYFMLDKPFLFFKRRTVIAPSEFGGRGGSMSDANAQIAFTRAVKVSHCAFSSKLKFWPKFSFKT